MLAALLLLAAPVQAGPYDIACVYPSRTQRELVDAPDCARRDGGLRFNPARLRDFAFTHGLIDVQIGRQYYYVRRNGSSQPVMTYDNGADEFQQGLARSEIDSKIGYVDRRLRLVLPRIYDGAFPFNWAGNATVCFGCKRETDGEHYFHTGGDWVCIDRRGREIGARFHAQPGQVARFNCDVND